MQNVHGWAILDSGATSHFLVIAAPTTDRQESNNPLIVKLPDGARVSSTHTCTLAIPELPAKARIAHIIPGLAAHSLLSIVQQCMAVNPKNRERTLWPSAASWPEIISE